MNWAIDTLQVQIGKTTMAGVPPAVAVNFYIQVMGLYTCGHRLVQPSNQYKYITSQNRDLNHTLQVRATDYGRRSTWVAKMSRSTSTWRLTQSRNPSNAQKHQSCFNFGGPIGISMKRGAFSWYLCFTTISSVVYSSCEIRFCSIDHWVVCKVNW